MVNNLVICSYFSFTDYFLLYFYQMGLQPDMQSKVQKEGAESEQFWDLLGGKSEYPSQKLGREAETDPHLFSCTLSKGRNIFVDNTY